MWNNKIMNEYFPNLIFNSDFCSQGVVSVPLLGEGQAVFWPLVFSFQAACYFAGVSVGGTSCFEFLQGTILKKEWQSQEKLKDNYSN